MKAREMWADTDWAENPGGMYVNAKRVHTSVRVLVQEIPEGVPFKVGDRVRCGVYKGTVIAVAPNSNGRWAAMLETKDTKALYAVFCDTLDLLPPETSRLIRVTGPEEDIEALTHAVETWHTGGEGVRVEVVDE